MGEKQLNSFYDDAIDQALITSFERIQMPSAATIKASWEAVQQKFEKELRPVTR